MFIISWQNVMWYQKPLILPKYDEAGILSKKVGIFQIFNYNEM